MNEILFLVEEADDGSLRAQAVGAPIYTEASSLEELHQEIRDAVHCHSDPGDAPPLIRLHHVRVPPPTHPSPRVHIYFT